MRTALHTPPECRSGVTLLELLVVIAVMVIVLTISMPAFTGMGRGAGMRGTVAEVKATLSLARQWAITKREPVTFKYGYDTSTTSDYYVVYIAKSDTNTIIQTTNYLQKGFYFFGEGEMIFKPSGEVANVNDHSINPITITITNLTGIANAKEIEIQKLTGSIYVK